MARRQALRQWSLDLLETLFLKQSKRNAVAHEDYDQAELIKQQEGAAGIRLAASRRSFLVHLGGTCLGSMIEGLQQRICVESDVDVAAMLQQKLTQCDSRTEVLEMAAHLLTDLAPAVLLELFEICRH